MHFAYLRKSLKRDIIDIKVGDIMGKTSAAVKNRYAAKAYDRINLIVKKGEKDRLKAHAEQQGETLNGFINRAIENQIQTDNENKECNQCRK